MITKDSQVAIENKAKENDISILTENIGNINKFDNIILKCNKCGKEFTTKAYLFKRSKFGGCPHCRRAHPHIYKNTTYIKSDLEIKEMVFKKFNNEYTIHDIKKDNGNIQVLISHSTCNSIPYWISYSELMAKKPNSKCKYCRGRYTLDEVKEEVDRISNGEYEFLSSEYMTNKNKYIFRHKTCGNTYASTLVNFLGTKNRPGRRCPFCANKYHTIKWLKDSIRNLTGDEYTLVTEKNDSDQITNSEEIRLLHSKCNKEYITTPFNFLHNGTRCTNIECSNHGTSKHEKKLFEFIKSIVPNAENNKRFYYNGKSYYEADSIIEDKKIIIEYDGLYWHAEGVKPTGKLNLLEKTKYFNDLGYRVIHIFEDEFTDKEDIVKNKLKHILNAETVSNEKIYARKCHISTITLDVSNSFLNKYHIQGGDKSSIRLGLFYNDDLVGVMTFCKQRKALGAASDSKLMELSRFALSRSIPGAFSKLLKFAIKDFGLTDIITYADLRWSDKDNNVYTKNGFTLDHISEPSYYYLDKEKEHRIHRYNFRKQVLKKKLPEFYDEKLTEYEIMKKAGYYRVWDCGNLVYRYKCS